MIQELTGSDLFPLTPLVPYSFRYSECIEQAKNDQKRNARPELVSYPQNLDAYDTVYLGFPNYWGTMPMPIFTLLERYDFSGKVIKPFCTHEGSGLGHSQEDIKRLCPNANVQKGLALLGGNVSHSRQEIKKWVTKPINNKF